MPELNVFDQTVMSFIQTHCHNAFTNRIFPVITYLGEGGGFWIVLGLLLVIFGKRSGWRATGWVVLLAMLAGLLIGEVTLKNIICRPRPFQKFPSYGELLIPPPSGWSFPSGHSCSSFAAAVVILRRDKRFGAGALTLAAFIAFSRVFLFVHYPTDVLAGAALGALCAWGVCWAYPRAAGWWKERYGGAGKSLKP